MTEITKGFLLTRQLRDAERGASESKNAPGDMPNGQSLIYWLATDEGPLRVEITDQESVFFVRSSELDTLRMVLGRDISWRHAQLELRCFHYPDESAVACYFLNQRDLAYARTLLRQQSVSVYEGDIRPTDRFLMERFVQGALEVSGPIEQCPGYREAKNPLIRKTEYAPRLSVVSLDIETSISSGVLLSIAVSGEGVSKVFVSGPEYATDLDYVECIEGEAALIERFLAWFADLDPDVVIGWNVVGFDLKYLQDRCDALGQTFSLGRAGESVHWRSLEQGPQRLIAVVPGRVVLDGIALLRTATYSFESFSLENVSRELLGRGKLVHDVDSRALEIEKMHRDDKDSLARYNLEDCDLVLDIFEHTNLLEFAIRRSCLTGLEIDRQGGSVATFDFLYLPRLHREGFVAPVVDEESVVHSPGGYVLDSKPGLYNDVIVLDFKSLYPSIIRTFHVDPLAMILGEEDGIPGFLEASFSREKFLLPKIIEELWAARDDAKRVGDTAGSQAIKIIMNSFYGVLGTPGCRFFDPRLASSITMRGHEILKLTRECIEDRGYPVIYGDTDSVFVHMNSAGDNVDAAGSQLASALNLWWKERLDKEYGIDCFLEIEFETHFSRFFMPTIRGSEKGSKKRYAGMIDKTAGPKLVFKGLESVRSDWTHLAKEFQKELYRLVFTEEDYVPYLKMTVDQVLQGERDEQLVLRRRLRRQLSDYVKNVPPHVRAARRADEQRVSRGLKPIYDNGGWIEYVMTVNGPEPLAFRESPLDYDFYIDRQLAPIADAILTLESTTLAELTDRQLGLF